MDPNSTLDITDTPLSQEIIDGTVAHIKALAGRCSTVNVHFLKIDQILSQTALDPENQFSQYRKQYTALLWKSREISGRAQADVADFSGDIFAVVLDTSISNHEKIEELEGAIIGWAKSRSSARDQLQTFQHLSHSLDHYASTVVGEQEAARNAETSLRAEIEQFNAEIKEMGTEIPADSPQSGLLASLAGCTITLLGGVYRGVLDRSPHSVYHAFGDALHQGIVIFRYPESDQYYDSAIKHGMVYMILIFTFLLTNAIVELIYRVVVKCTKITGVVLHSLLKGSPRVAIDELCQTFRDGKSELGSLKLSLSQETEQRQAPTQEESKAKLLTKLNDVMATLDNAVAILQEIPVLQDEIGHFLNESKVFNDVYDELTSGSLNLISVLKGGHGTDLATKVAALRNILSTLANTLALYARGQLEHMPEAPPAYSSHT